MSKDYIRDNGKIRNCNSNIAKMNVLEYIWLEVTKYKFFQYGFAGVGDQLIKGAKYLGAAIINLSFLVLFPVFLPIKAYLRIRDAKKEVREFEKQWGGNQ